MTNGDRSEEHDHDHDQDLDVALDEIYAVPRERFVARRDELARVPGTG